MLNEKADGKYFKWLKEQDIKTTSLIKTKKTSKGYEGITPAGKPFIIWKDERLEFVRTETRTYERKINQWILNLDGKRIEGFGTKRQALQIAELH